MQQLPEEQSRVQARDTAELHRHPGQGPALPAANSGMVMFVAFSSPPLSHWIFITVVDREFLGCCMRRANCSLLQFKFWMSRGLLLQSTKGALDGTLGPPHYRPIPIQTPRAYAKPSA